MEKNDTDTLLLKMKDRLESILQAMKDVMVSFSPADQSVVAVNPAVEALYGVPERDFRTGRKSIIDFVHPDDLEAVKHFYAAVPELEFAELTYRILDVNQRLKWVLDEGTVVYGEKGRLRRIDHMIRDITEEKLAADALKKSEEKYRSFFESTRDMIVVVALDGTFLDINDAGVQLIGFRNRQEALDANINDFYVDISEREHLLDELREKGFVANKLARFKKKNGKIIEVAITVHSKKNDSGEIIYNEGLIHNITQAMEDQRNKVLRNAAGGLCHYLNSHLATLLFTKELMERDMQVLHEIVAGLPIHERKGHPSGRLGERLTSLQESIASVGHVYKEIAKVTGAFNSAFLTYAEEAYLDKTILDIFSSLGDGKNDE